MDRLKPYAKAAVAVAGVVVVVGNQILGGASLVDVVTAVVAAVGVYLTPNKP